MKKILLALMLPFAAAAQTSVQKVGSGNNTISNGAIVIGSNNSLTATGTGIIAATTVPNITISTTAPLVGGGSLAGNLTLSMPFATSLVDGYLKAADWTTFNAKQPAGNYITALTGDGTAAGPGSSALTLATVNTNVGTFAASTVNGKGLVTAAGNLTGDITTSGAAATLATVNSNVGTFAGITINGKGLATAASNLTITTTAPITGGGILGNLTFAMPAASSTVNGYLTSTDWNTFNGKENVLTFNAPLSRTANAVSIPVSTNSVDGYLSGADHTTFAAKQPAGNYLTALTGDGTAAGPGSSALTLATVNTNVGTFAGITLNGKGLATGASNLTITTTAPLTGGGTLGNLTIAEPASTNSVDGYLTAADHTTFAAKQPAGNYITALTGDATAAGPGSSVLTLANVATGATTGSSTAIPVVTFTNKGLVTGVTTAPVVAPAGTLTGTTLAANVVSSSLNGLGNVTTGTWSADVIGVAKGGTNLSSYTTGDLLYATGATTIGKLPDVATGSVLISGGVGSLPTYAAVSGIAVTSITGTANQIAASASIGSVTLSIPTNPTLPGNVTATGTSTATQLIAAGNPELTAVTTIAALEALTVTGLTTNTSVNVLGYYAANDGGGGLFTFTTSSSATVDHGLVCSTPSAGTTRWIRDYAGPINIRWLGAKGDGSHDDTTAIQNASTAATTGHGTLYIPAANTSQYYKVTTPITFASQLSIIGDTPTSSIVIGVGMSAGQYTFDFNLSATPNYFWEIKNICVRSLDHVPNGIRLKNVSYVSMKNVWIYGCYDGLSIQGSDCFSNVFENVVSYTSQHHGMEFAAGFTGGGQYTFTHCTFDGDTGFYVADTAGVFGLSLRECNFEGCVTNSAYVGGSVQGLSFLGPRTENNAGSVDFNINPASGNVIAGLVITGGAFTANSASCTAIQMGGAGGVVRGFSITGNYANNSSVTQFVRLNGDGESGQISGNKFLQSATTPTNTTRAGVVVFSNENGSGKCSEYWGASSWGVTEYNWTPTDQSGASLTFPTAAGYATKIGRVVVWQCVVVYPTTADTSQATIGGLPSNPTLGGVTQGRAGAHLDSTNAGLDIGVFQGTPDTNKLQLSIRGTEVSVTNAQLSGKQLYMSGQYTL